jgi:hypothetical protein
MTVLDVNIGLSNSIVLATLAFDSDASAPSSRWVVNVELATSKKQTNKISDFYKVKYQRVIL